MTLSHTYNSKNIDYRLVRKKRKSLGIYIDAYGNIELRVPKTASDEAIEKLLESKWSWIIEKQKEQKEKTKGFKEKDYGQEEEVLYLGVNCPVKIEIEAHLKKAMVTYDRGVIVIRMEAQDEAMVKKLLIRFYKQQCKKIVNERIRHFQPLFKVKPKSIDIRSNQKYWGQCTSLREISFNWKLAMAPLDVIDYVVVHEMCHMVHMNHDRSFWRLVGKHIPNYEAKRDWLHQSHWKMVV